MRPLHEQWGAWLHALWGDRVQVLDIASPPADARPVLTGTAAGRALHLPAGAAASLGDAAAAHAAAHWRFGQAPQERAGLKPVQQALYEVLEDARVEALALRELPGLRALWLPFHTGDDAPAGNGFDALLARLARSLLETGTADAHPWVVRARSEVLAAGYEAQAVRTLASRIGNDIGQMRLPFNPRVYRVHAAYRDDGSWLWLPEAAAPSSNVELAAGATAAPPPDSGVATEMPLGGPTCYPEWDQRIGRYRADWSSVYTFDAQAGAAPPFAPDEAVVRRRLERALGTLRGGLPSPAGRAAWGDDFHPMALIDAHVQNLARQPPNERVYRHRATLPRTLAVLVLVDTSASTADPAAYGRPLLQHLLASALACAGALEATGHVACVLAFSSRTRHRVEVRPLKTWSESARDPLVRARCAAQRSGGSTRMGAALRHACAEVRARVQRDPVLQPLVLLLTDGEPHDVDAHDPAYLRGDVRRAGIEAHAAGVAVRVVLAGGASGRLAGLPVARLRHPAQLAEVLVALLAA